MEIVKRIPEKLGKHALCPGCGHGIVLRLIEEVIDELGQANNQIVVQGVGCICTATSALKFDRFQAAHGRATSTAEGVKRVRPDVTVFTYQGDGDAYTIAWRHIHVDKDTLAEMGLDYYKSRVSVKTEGIRATTLENVTLVPGGKGLLMHIDLEEGNAAGCKNGDMLEIVL